MDLLAKLTSFTDEDLKSCYDDVASAAASTGSLTHARLNEMNSEVESASSSASRRALICQQIAHILDLICKEDASVNSTSSNAGAVSISEDFESSDVDEDSDDNFADLADAPMPSTAG